MDIRDRYRVPGSDDGQPAQPVHEALRHAYQPPPRPAAAQPRQPQPVSHSQPVRHQTVNETPSKQRRHKASKPRLWPKAIVFIVILAALASAGVYAYPRYIKSSPFPAAIRDDVDGSVRLLYPTKLPEGYQIDKTSFNYANGILIYAATNNDKRIVFTLQKTPDNFDFTSFYKQQLSGTQQYQTTYGQATVGKNDKRYLGSLPAGDTWLILSTNSTKVNINDLAVALQNLKQY